MELWQFFVGVFGILGLVGSLQAATHCRTRKMAYHRTLRIYEIFGAFVWGDMVVFGLFWFGVSFVSVFRNDWLLFLLTLSLFWFVRSLGETIYWLNQQFTPRSGNEPEQYLAHKIFGDDSVWFAHQIFWQCITVVTIISSLYLGKLWLVS